MKAQNLFPEDIQAKILDEVHELFDGTYAVIRPGPWKRAFRPSGFPYCPVLDAMSGPEDMDYGKAFYLDIGTTVHELMQEYISRSVRGKRMVYCDWKCKQCGFIHRFTPLPYVCANCGADSEELHYEELEFENFRGIQGGHVDLLIETSFGWIVCDWKTASTTGLDYRKEADGKHHHQLQAYCLAIQELFKDKLKGKPVIGYMLIFVPRDSSGDRNTKGSNWTPFLYLWDDEIAQKTRKRLFMQRASFEAATIGYETGNWLPAAWLRPCQSLADFGKPMGMRDGFYGGAQCENLDICCRSSEHVATAITKFRTDLKQQTETKLKLTNETKAHYLQCASQGFLPPTLLEDIKKAQDAVDDYDHDRLEELLGIKESLERVIEIRQALSKDNVTGFFNVGENARTALAPVLTAQAKSLIKVKTPAKTAGKPTLRGRRS